MAGSSINTNNVAIHFQNEVNREYVRGGIFSPFKGKDSNAIIQVKQDEKKVSIPLVTKLKGNGVTGSSSLAGNEEALSNYAFTLQPTYYRNGVLVDNEENEKSEFDLYQEAKPALMNWAMELQRDQIIQAMAAIEAGGTYVNYGSASAANLDTWQAANTDRILYGKSKSNTTSGDHTTSLGTIDTTNDVMKAGTLTLLKRIAKSANPLIKPYMLKNDQEYYVLFLDSYGFRDLEADTTIVASQQNALERGKDNPLFQAGDIMWRGIIVKELPDLNKFIDGDSSGSAFDGVLGANAASADGLDDGGASSSRIGIGFLCGAQAVGMGLGKMPAFKRRKEDDYEHQNGVGISMKHDIKKMFYNGKQHGMVTVFYSATKDA
jgi:hypothetical protein